MKCEELLAVLNDYISGDLDPALCEKLRKHLEECQPCQVVVDNILRTIAVFKEDEPADLPAELHERFARVLRDRWKAKFPL